MVAAAAEVGVATRELAAYALARLDLLGIEPLSQRDGALVEAFLDHRVANLCLSPHAGKGTRYSPMIFSTIRLGRRPSHSP